ncbi:MAG: discoidin domain-containing protein [Syntrophomonadaceae bacterium]|nr:discoidin domain-containing protein [Syntrophomonadaceae bacterium]
MKKYSVILIALALILMIPGFCLASFNHLYWQYYKALPTQASGFSAIKLDKDIMLHCQENFSDLRVTDQDGREISSQVLRPEKQRQDIATTQLNRNEYLDRTSLVLDLGPNPLAHNRIDVYLDSSKDYMREVTLEASQDNETWGNIGTGRIMMYQGRSYNTLSFTTNTARYLRVNVNQVNSEKRLPLTDAIVYFMPISLYQGESIPVKILSQRSDRTRTNLVVDLQVPNYFIDRVTIETPDRNYSRVVYVDSDNATSKSNQPLTLNTDTIFDYKWQDYSSARDYVEIGQYARRFLFISIENGSSAPLKINAIKVSASPPYLLADLKGPSRLWYGNPNVNNESYDLDKFAYLIQTTDLKWVTPGAQQINPDYKVPWSEQNKWLLNALIILVAFGFVVIILRNLDKIKELRKGEDQ